MMTTIECKTKAYFRRRTSVASNAIQTMDNEIANVIIFFKLHLTRLKCNVYETGLM